MEFLSLRLALYMHVQCDMWEVCGMQGDSMGLVGGV